MRHGTLSPVVGNFAQSALHHHVELCTLLVQKLPQGSGGSIRRLAVVSETKSVLRLAWSGWKSKPLSTHDTQFANESTKNRSFALIPYVSPPMKPRRNLSLHPPQRCLHQYREIPRLAQKPRTISKLGIMPSNILAAWRQLMSRGDRGSDSRDGGDGSLPPPPATGRARVYWHRPR
jgi:hypothetical protein